MGRRQPDAKNRSRAGQAMAEFLVGLVGIMVLVVGLQQVAKLSEGSFKMHFNIRKSLAEQMVDPMADYVEGFVFATKTAPGLDGKNYTADDAVVIGNDGFFKGRRGFRYAVDYSALDGYLNAYDRDNPYSRLSDSSFSDLSENFEMLYAMDMQSVEVAPFLRRMLGRDTLNLRREAWMPKLDGLLK